MVVGACTDYFGESDNERQLIIFSKVFTKDRIGETDNNYLLIDIKMLVRVAHKNGKL